MLKHISTSKSHLTQRNLDGCPGIGLGKTHYCFRSSGDASGHAEYKAIWHAHLEDKYLSGL
jgi:hypothetical protein